MDRCKGSRWSLLQSPARDAMLEELRGTEVQRSVEATICGKRAVVQLEERASPSVERHESIEHAADVGEHRVAAVGDPAIELQAEATVGEEPVRTDVEQRSCRRDSLGRLGHVRAW